ncbi:MAG: sialidase family protein [Armatimonadota bacterium]
MVEITRASNNPLPPTPLAALREWARIVQYPDGSLAAFAVRSEGTGQAVSAWFSADGNAWEGPEPLVLLPKGMGLWGGVEALVDRDGEVHLFLLNDLGSGSLGNTAGEEAHPELKAGEVRLDLWHLRSRGGRREWPQPQRIWEGYTGALNSVAQLRSGRILLPFSYLIERTWRNRGEGLDTFTFRGTYLSTVIYSDDNGRSWQLSPTLLKVPTPDITYAYGAVEPVVLELRDGRVWMLIRTQMGRFYESFSPDGAAWSLPEPSPIISSDSPAGLARLADGRIALLWNNCLRHPYAYGGRQVLHGAVSDDEGKTWRGCREVARDPFRNEPPPPHGDHGTAYPFPTALRDGSLLFTTGQGEGRVQLMRLEPAWLDEMQDEDYFSAGLNAWSVFGTKGVELLPHPDQPDRQALRLARIDAEFPACAVRNFPLGRTGTFKLRFQVEAASSRFHIGLTDHFSPPFDREDRFHNLFNLHIDPAEVFVSTGEWHELSLSWDMQKRTCNTMLDGRFLQTLPQLHESPGPSYLRLRAEEEAGILVESISMKNEA